MILVFALALILAITGYHVSKNDVKAQMLKEGVSPLAINCVLDDEYNNDPKCMVLATLQANQPSTK